MDESGARGFRLSLQQNQLWSAQGEAAPFSQLVLLLEGPLDPTRLDAALLKLIERHEILRTTFVRRSGMKVPFQVVNEATPPGLIADGVHESGAPENMPAVKMRLRVLGPDRHELALQIPAFCADRDSLHQIADELALLYAGQEPEAEPLQYADYSAWQTELLESAEAEAGKKFWDQRSFSGALDPALPFEQQGGLGGIESIEVLLDSAAQNLLLTNGIEFFLTAWQCVLSRYTGNSAIAVGRVSDGRNHEELNGAVGLFSKVVPSSVALSPDTTFRMALEQNLQHATEMRAQEDYLPAGLADGLTIGFSSSRIAQSTRRASMFSVERIDCPIHRFKLELQVIENAGVWTARLAYDSQRLRKPVVQQIARSLSVLLASAVANPESPIESLPLLDDDQRNSILVEFNQTRTTWPREQCIHQIVEAQAAKFGQRIALRFGEQTYTYADLNSRANRLARFLRVRGAAPNRPVALMLERSADMIVAVLAILKTGSCYVPLVPGTPRARLAFQLAESAPAVVITDESLPDFPGSVISPSLDSALYANESGDNLNVAVSPSDLAYVIYTSGSTGTPKGVAVPHSCVVNYSNFICSLLNGEEPLHFATVSTLAADLGNTAVFPALMSGGCLHVIGYDTAMDRAQFSSYAAAHPIDVLKITPSHLESLLDGNSASVLPRKTLFLGGEALTWSLLDRIRALNKCAVINHYGPTEATVGCCTFDTSQATEETRWATTVPIGKPIANDRVYLLDAHMEPVPVGVPGELWVGGAGVAQGYLNQPEQTSEKFVEHHFPGAMQDRLYRTGDLARFLPDGAIEFLGRIDQQVKIRGFRVEPAEITVALEQHPGIRQAVTVPFADAAGEKRIAAYLIAAGEAPSTGDLRTHLLARLPDYMTPSAFVYVKSFPLTPNGKVDMGALPPVDTADSSTTAHFTAPRTPDEEALAAIWQEVLGGGQVSVTANFFELGGHSLMATQIISRVRNRFRVQMPLRTFLQMPTIAELAVNIAQCTPIETEEEEMARLLDQIEGLSDEEAQQLLASMEPGPV